MNARTEGSRLSIPTINISHEKPKEWAPSLPQTQAKQQRERLVDSKQNFQHKCWYTVINDYRYLRQLY